MDPVFKLWSALGLHTIKDLYIDNCFASFAQLQSKFMLPSAHLFRYLQIRNFVKQSFAHLDKPPAHSDFYDYLIKNPTSKHLISQFTTLFTLTAPTNHIKDAWVKDLEVDISDALWANGLKNIKECSVNARLQLIQFKVLHRLHFSKTKLCSIFPSLSSLCYRCKALDGTLGHLFWSCPTLRSFWAEIFNIYNRVYDLKLEPDGVLAVLGCSLTSLALRRPLQKALMFGMIVAKRLILRAWKSPSPPLFRVWLREMIACLYIEEVRYRLADTHVKFVEIWGPFLNHIDGNST
ncbi:unnamed protein product [Oreochromis niloticus]|nr:unnamed protein product [Mustela putorius furo]